MSRSFAPTDAHHPGAPASRPPVGEEGAAYAVVRRYLWPDEAPPAPVAGEGDPDARSGRPVMPAPPAARP